MNLYKNKPRRIKLWPWQVSTQFTLLAKEGKIPHLIQISWEEALK